MIKAPEARFPGKLSQILSVFVSSVSQLSHVFHKFAAKYSIVNFIEECGISMDEAVRNSCNPRYGEAITKMLIS